MQIVQKEASIAIKLVATYLQKSNNQSKYSKYPGRLKLHNRVTVNEYATNYVNAMPTCVDTSSSFEI